jgi:lysophospholipase L1-like esterase
LLLWTLLSTRTCLAGNNLPIHLTLPPEFYAVSGVEMSIYYDNVVLAQNPEQYQFHVTCDIGQAETRRWTVTPKPEDVGAHDLTVSVSDANGQQIEEASLVLHVAASDAGAGDAMRLLIVGDSLTHHTIYPNEIARLLSRPGNPRWKMLGTHRPKGTAPGVAHEGYGGWTWQRFVSAYEPHPDGTHQKRSSPFVYLDEDGKPTLNVMRYIREECEGDPPSFVMFMLGINDCFQANPDDPIAMDKHIDAMTNHSDTLLAAFRLAAPNAVIGICITTPPNSREEAFQTNYKDQYHRWGWKRIQHRIVQRHIAKFTGREKDQLYIVPTQLNLDPLDGYPPDNAVHPNERGYKQISASIYSFLKHRFEAHPQ